MKKIHKTLNAMRTLTTKISDRIYKNKKYCLSFSTLSDCRTSFQVVKKDEPPPKRPNTSPWCQYSNLVEKMKAQLGSYEPIEVSIKELGNWNTIVFVGTIHNNDKLVHWKHSIQGC